MLFGIMLRKKKLKTLKVLLVVSSLLLAGGFLIWL